MASVVKILVCLADRLLCAKADISCTCGRIYELYAFIINQERFAQTNRHIYLLLKKDKHFRVCHVTVFVQSDE